MDASLSTLREKTNLTINELVHKIGLRLLMYSRFVKAKGLMKEFKEFEVWYKENAKKPNADD